MRVVLFAVALALILGSCGGGSSKSTSDFRLIQFLENGQDEVPRNRVLSFRFSAPVAPLQDFFERLKIQNVQAGQNPNFARAVGIYVIDAERVTFTPQLPELLDRADAGFRANANYVVFLKSGPDSLTSASGDTVARPQEFFFDTNEYFEDFEPTQPPRALALLARDVTNGQTTDISRLDPRPSEQADLDSAALIDNGRFIDPGAGGLPRFQTPWRLELTVSEPVDPATVTTKNIEMREIFAEATTSGDLAPPDAPDGVDYKGVAVDYKVPITVEVDQGWDAQGHMQSKIVVIPKVTLVDNTRYRLAFGGHILGLDFRESFIGANGLTGDGQTVLPGDTDAFPEPGGLGYVTEFIVRDRPAINSGRTLTYDPVVDGIQPEFGQSVLTEDRYNSALYNPASFPGTAVGFLSAFGQGTDGDLAVAGGQTVTIDTGDTPNKDLGNPFEVLDLNPDDDYLSNTLPGKMVTWDSPEPFELQLSSLTVSNASTLKIIGVNPCFLRITGICQIDGLVDVSGEDGVTGGGAVASGGGGGAAGFGGGDTKQGSNACTWCGTCDNFSTYLNGCSQAKSTFPHTLNGQGPGRGYAGGEVYAYDYQDDFPNVGGTGGGGGSHALRGTAGEDRLNASAAPGSPGGCRGSCPAPAAGVVGVRGQPGAIYGDREVELVLLGGSGGGGGGSNSVWGGPKNQAGGAGGGGGGSISIISAGPILLTGGVIDASGGDGGQGGISVQSQPNNWRSTSGGGGGGAGGTISLISGNDIATLSGAVLDARGGAGGLRSSDGSGVSCAACNAGGDGGNGFIFLMDTDGLITGLLPGQPGYYDQFDTGVLTISPFVADRFSSITAVTELFSTLVSDPAYLALSSGDVLAHVNNADQRIRVYASSAHGDLLEPLIPDPTTEMGMIEVALISRVGGSVGVEIRGDMRGLNPMGTPNRDAFVRIEARFEYDKPVEAALGPFASIDQVDISFTFNG